MEVRIPAIITGIAMGNSILVNRFNEDIPIPVAASFNAGSTSLIPVYVLRKIGNNPYIVRATIAGVVPIPKKGIKNAKTAKLGIVCKIAVKPIIGSEIR